MSDTKNSMIFFYDWLNLFDELSDAEIGQLVMAALRYDQTGEDTKFPDKGMRVAFKAIKNSIKVSNEKYQAACEKKRKAMEKRWKKIQNADSNQYISIDNYSVASDTDTDTDTKSDTDTDTVTVTDTDTVSGSGSGMYAANAAEPPRPPQFEEKIIRIWNEQKCTQPIRQINDYRRALINNCDQPEKFLQTIRELDQQNYLAQKARDNKPVMFDWFIQPENYNKVAEGNYKATFGGSGNGLARDW